MNITNISTTTQKYSIPTSTSQITPSTGSNDPISPTDTQVMLDIYDIMRKLFRNQITQQEAANRIKNTIGDPQVFGEGSLFNDLPLDMQKEINKIYNHLLDGSADWEMINELNTLITSIPSKVSVEKLIAQDLANLYNQVLGTGGKLTAETLRAMQSEISEEVGSIYNELSDYGKNMYNELMNDIQVALNFPDQYDPRNDIEKHLYGLYTDVWNLAHRQSANSVTAPSPVTGNDRIAGQLAAGRV